MESFAAIVSEISRYAFVLIAVYVALRCLISLFCTRSRVLVKGQLQNALNGDRLELYGREISVGRNKNCDIVLNYPMVSRLHAVISYRGNSFRVFNTLSKTGVFVNGEEVAKSRVLENGDRLSFGGAEFILYEGGGGGAVSVYHKKHSRPNYVALFALLTLFDLLALGLLLLQGAGNAALLISVFSGFILLMWLCYITERGLFKTSCFEIELLGFLLAGIGFSIGAGVYPDSLLNQFLAIVIGVCGYICLIAVLKYPGLAGKVRWPAAGLAAGLLAVTIVVAEPINGALSWIRIGGFSLQPSELAKVAFIFVGAATLEKLQSMRSLTKYIIFAVVCVGELFYMNDFGTALIFFFTFLVLAFMRSGDIRTIMLICAAALLGALLIIKFRPYIADRFSTYLHVWDDIYGGGYQQTRVLIYSVSGGLFGLGLGHGELRGVFAAAEDLVFGVVCEEFGCIIGFLVPAVYTLLAVYAIINAKAALSSFYAIAAVGAAALLLFQTVLNVFGVTDFLPLTGVTLPLVSKGGSSVICCFCLLAYIKGVKTEPVK